MTLSTKFELLLDNPVYAQVAAMLQTQNNLFILAKGSGFFVANYMAQKFLQVASINAEAYPCAEFRHGPLSMIDEHERTPGKSLTSL